MGTERPSQPLSKLRLLAAEILSEVYHSDQSLEESVTRVLVRKSAKTFPEFDRAWLYEIASGVLRHRGRVDYVIDTYSLKKKPTGLLRRLLQVGVFQLLVLDVEPALVVSETVEAIRLAEGDAPSKFANAILRKVADKREEWRAWRVNEGSPFEEQLAWCSLPEWLFKKLRKERGSDWLFAFSESVLQRPRIWYRTPTETLLLEKGYRGDEPPGFVQDISNQKLSDKVAEILKSRFPKNPKILDLCSAPGGKSLALAFAGFNVIATDLSEERMQRVVENRSRLKLENKIEIRPYEEIKNGDEKFDAIWIDAPCSSIGIIRRHPEIKWNRNFEDVEKLVDLQKNLIEWAKDHLSSNGIIIYSTCSLLSIETKPETDLRVLETFQWDPQIEPSGDGISALILAI
jgi:16S rRNA (cytosine967-C5)-methyltransferase